MIADATSYSEAGYVGEDVENMVLYLLQNADYNVGRAERGIAYIDEVEGVALKFTRGALDALAEEAILRKAGARGLWAIMEAALLDVMYGLPSREDGAKCLITADVVRCKARLLWYYHPERQQA